MKALKMVTKGLAGLAFVALLTVNVQVGSGSPFKLFSISNVKAIDCPSKPDDVCAIVIFPDGLFVPSIGEPITVTPPKN